MRIVQFVWYCFAVYLHGVWVGGVGGVDGGQCAGVGVRHAWYYSSVVVEEIWLIFFLLRGEVGGER